MPKVRWVCVAFVANFMSFPTVQKFWKSAVKIWQRYKEFKGGNLFWDTVYNRYAQGLVISHAQTYWPTLRVKIAQNHS